VADSIQDQRPALAPRPLIDGRPAVSFRYRS
jgi:hypothetical protein